MIDTLRLSAHEAATLLRNKEISGAELWEAYRRAIDERDGELHCFLHVCDDPGGDGLPLAVKDVIGTKGIPDDRRLADSRGLRPGLRLHCRSAGESGSRPADPRQDEHRRVRDGLVDRELRVRPDAQPVGSLARAGRLGRRLGSGGQRRSCAVGARLRHRRLDQAAVRTLRQRRPAPDLRHRLPLRNRRLCVEPRPGRPGRPQRPRLRLPLLDHRRPRRVRHDDRRAAAARRGARGAGSEGSPDRRAEGVERGGRHRARRGGGGGGRDRASSKSSVPRWGSARCRSPSSTGWPATT